MQKKSRFPMEHVDFGVNAKLQVNLRRGLEASAVCGKFDSFPVATKAKWPVFELSIVTGP